MVWRNKTGVNGTIALQRTPLHTQMEEKVGSAILINQFTVESNEAGHLLNAWAADAPT